MCSNLPISVKTQVTKGGAEIPNQERHRLEQSYALVRGPIIQVIPVLNNVGSIKGF
jgi:hypothetical protein